MARPKKVLSEAFLQHSRELFQIHDKETALRKLGISLRTHQRYLARYPEYEKSVTVDPIDTLEHDPEIKQMFAELENINLDDVSFNIIDGEQINFISKDEKTKVSISRSKFTDKEVDRLKKRYKHMTFVSREFIPEFSDPIKKT